MLMKISFYSAIVSAYIIFLIIPQIRITQGVNYTRRGRGRPPRKKPKEEKPFNLSVTLREFRIVPYFVPVEPKHVCNITFEDLVAGQGKKIPQEMVILNKPNITWPYKNNTYYTLMMADVDTHSEEMMTMKESFSWLVCDIPRNDIDKGRTVYTYFGENTLMHGGFHRHVVYIFKQKVYPLNIHLPAIHDNWRWTWRIFEFAQYFNLSLVPVAGNLFLLDARRRSGG